MGVRNKRNRIKGLALVTTIYWVLLTYIVAALVWWFISLERQSNRMYEYQVQAIRKDTVSFDSWLATLDAEKRRRTFQYVGEGSVFLLLILLGAVFVFRATRRQISLWRQQENFMMAVTHELKTPIAVARLNLETLLKRKLPEEQQQKLLRSALAETERLQSHAENILVSSQLEAGSYRLRRQEIDLSEIVAARVKEFSNRFPERLRPELEPGLTVSGEPDLLAMLVNNLIDNAVKYSPPEAIVTVRAFGRGRNVFLEVRDEGPGIPAAERERVFEKFYRVGNEGTRTSKGTGLGLYLCRRIAKDHGGSVSFAPNEPAGAIFTVKLPKR